MITGMTRHFMPEQQGSLVPEFTLGDRLRKAREIAGLSQAELAAEIGISRNSVVNYESQTKRIPRPSLVSWALRTHVDLGWLSGEQTSPPPAKRPRRDSNAGQMAYMDGVSPLVSIGHCVDELVAA